MNKWLLFLLFSVLPVFAAPVSQLFREYRDLHYEAELLKKSASREFSGITFSRDHLDLKLTEIRKRQEEYQDELIRLLFQELSLGRSSEFNRFCDFIAGIENSDTARAAFMPIKKQLEHRIKSELLGKKFMPSDRNYAVLERNLSRLEAVFSTISPAKGDADKKSAVPIYVSFLWHMHQPIYWPYEDVIATQNRGVYSYNVLDIFYSREGAYTNWPHNAVAAGLDLPHLGAQVSFSGSLIENLNTIENAGLRFHNWRDSYIKARNMKTELGNPRLDLVAFGYHHPLMPLCDYNNIRKQIQRHREIIGKNFGTDPAYSKGIFPPENAFAEWIIPALVDEGIEWALVDNIHFNRAVENYPWVKGENLFPPNKADQKNPPVDKWVQLNGLWAPSKVSAWAYKPHYVVHTDPETGRVATTPEGKPAKMIAVPTARYMGNEDGRGGFGALNYEAVMSQLEELNTDPNHPILIVLHHDGDNYGGGSYGYYHDNFQRFVDWARNNRHRFVPTTVQDYLQKYPVDENDIIHVEPGSWAGADNGDPEFKKWLANPDPETGYSYDVNSWGTMVAARNYVHTAAALAPDDERTKKAWDFMLVAETSCYEYWDGTEMWDSHPTRAVNEAVKLAREVIPAGFNDTTPPSIFMPQRTPYNPGAFQWSTEPEQSDVRFWTYVHDVSGLEGVYLNYRQKGQRGWHQLEMVPHYIESQTVPAPVIKADEYSVLLSGLAKLEIEYFVSAKDTKGNEAKSPANLVYIDRKTAQSSSQWLPEKPTAKDEITIYSTDAGFLHWGVNGWLAPIEEYWPESTKLWPDGKAVHSKLQGPDAEGRYFIKIGPFDNPVQPVSGINFVFHFLNDSWGTDKKITLTE